MIRHALAVSLLFLPTSLAAAPTVSVVVGSKAPSLELDAAGELTSQWKKVFGVTAGIVRDKAPDTGVAVLVGSPTTNPAVANAVGKAWPKVPDQGLVIRSLNPPSGARTLVVGC